MQLRTRITLVVMLSTLLVAVAALFGLYRGHHAVVTFQSMLSVETHQASESHEIVIDFKTQVQEWKNVLIRGKDEAQRRKYWAAFEKSERVVRERARRLRDALPEAHSLRASMDRFLSAHESMGASYRRGLQALVDAQGDPSAGDRAVKGIDRAPAELLDNITGSLERAAAARAEQVSSTSRRDTLISLLTMAVAVAVGAFVTVWTLRRSLAPLNDAVTLAERVAQGDLSSTVRVHRQDEIGRLLMALKAMNDGLAKVVSHVRSGSDSIATAAGEIAAGNTSLSQRTEEQASSLQQTASSMEQLSSLVRANAGTARAARELAGQAAEVAGQGGEVVERVIATMDQISAGSKKIAEIIGVIDAIAFQTNILALNAAVEAARAGEQGRGFAVVASEVRTLAGRSAEAARQIRSLIGSSVDQVASGCSLVTQAGHTMQDIVGQVDRVAQLIGEIDSAAQEQTTGIAQVAGAVSQLDQVTQQNAALVEQAAAAAGSLDEQARSMVDAVRVFKLAA